jgi:alpha-D-ribose 1-methylphosphonate 5-triphosphate synthase subunit PhnG
VDRLKELADRCLKGAEVQMLSAPKPVLLMARVRETVDGELFNLGEILATSCEVSLNGTPGWGTVLGDDPERSLCAAVLDAAVRGAVPAGVAEEVRGELALQLAFAREARRERWAAVGATRVEFEEMA